MQTNDESYEELTKQLKISKELMRIVGKYSGIYIWRYDVANRRIIKIDGIREDSIYGECIDNIPERFISDGYVYPESRQALCDLYKAVNEGRDNVSAVVKIRMRDIPNEYKWAKIKYIFLENKDWALGISEDVTEQKNAEIRAFNEENMRKQMLDDLLFSFRYNLNLDNLEEWEIYSETLIGDNNCINGGLQNLSDIKPGNNIASQMSCRYEDVYKWILNSIAHESDRKRFETLYSLDLLSEEVNNNSLTSEFEFRLRNSNGLIKWVRLNICMIKSTENDDIIIFGYGKDIDIQKKWELSLQKRVEIDEVSSLYNMSTAKLMIENIISESKEDGYCAFVVYDVDGFSYVNEHGGFLIADKILGKIGRVILERVPANKCIAGRLSGDVFVVFYYGMESPESIYKSAEDIRKAMGREYIIGDFKVDLTVSAGIVYGYSLEYTYDQMYQYALTTLDIAKKDGKDRMISYSEIENLKSDDVLQIMVDPKTNDVVDINPAACIAFGVKNEPIKCYELMRNRKEMCPFCSEREVKHKKETWECFIPRLNKKMYIREQRALKDGHRVRLLCFKETPFKTNNSDVKTDEIYAKIDACWENLEKGVRRTRTLYAILNYIGHFYKAEKITVLKKDSAHPESLLKQDFIWKDDSLEESINVISEDTERINELLLEIYPKRSLIINAGDNDEYHMTDYFTSDTIPDKIMIAGMYNNGNVSGCIILENCRENTDETKPLELVGQFIRRADEIYELRDKYDYIKKYDVKTDMLNYDSYVQYIESSNDDMYSSFGMVGLRIASLRQYNNKYGTSGGDQMLIFAADALKKYFKEQNCFRISGSNFIAVCPDIAYNDFVDKFTKFEEYVKSAYPGWIVCEKAWSQNAISVEKLQMQVEDKMQIMISGKETDVAGVSGQTTEVMLKNLKGSISHGHLRTFLQPKADIISGKICGAEALVRYYDEEKGIIPPARFLPEIEHAGLIRYIDLFILEDVCRIIKEWIQLGIKPIVISLNYSKATILEKGILEKTNEIVERYGIPKDLIEIEITETLSAIDSESLKDIAAQFVGAGYKIALDDFGTEYSNIYVLYSLNLHSLKLDRSIIGDIYNNNKARLVVKNVINACKGLDIQCVAEGVETKDQLGVLQELSCDVMQGYYLNKPMAEADFRKTYMVAQSS